MSDDDELRAIKWRGERMSGRGVLLVPEDWCVPHSSAVLVAWQVLHHNGSEYVVVPDPWCPGPDAYWLPPMPDLMKPRSWRCS